MATWYGSSVAYAAVAQFAITHAYSVGDIVRQLATPTVGNERCFRCTTAGTSAGSEPAWVLTNGATTTSGTAVFTAITGQSAFNSPSSMPAPFANLKAALVIAGGGDTVLFANNHAFVGSASYSTGGGGLANLKIVSIDSSGNFSAGASETLSGGGSIGYTFNPASAYIYGFTLGGGNGAGIGATVAISPATYAYLHNCIVFNASTGTPSTTLSTARITFDNTQVKHASAGGIINGGGGWFVWKNTANPIASGGVAPATLFQTSPVNTSIYAVDFSSSGLTNAIVRNGQAGITSLFACAIPAGLPINQNSSGSSFVMVSTAVSSSGQVTRMTADYDLGSVTTNYDIVRTNGASDAGGTLFSHTINSTSSNTNWQNTLDGLQLSYWNTTLSAITLTVEGIANQATMPTNDEVWIEGVYMATPGSTLGAVASSGMANPLATNANNTASSAAWDSGLTARQNTHAYVLGDLIKLASNPGRAFACTTAGTSAGSEPGGYATAVDGSAITDGSAHFQAMWRFKMTVTVTPGIAGLIYITPRVGKQRVTATGIRVVDPSITVT